MTPLSVIIGPTAAGKSAVALRLAAARGLSIVTADSRQVYRHFDIGTAKPDAIEQGAVPHYGIDVVDPTERYSAQRWASDATRWLADARARGRPGIVVGGTGFYVRALVEPLAATPALDPERRARLERWLAGQDGDTVAQWARRLDPARASLGRTQQLRAIETALLAGVRLGDMFTAAQRDGALTPAPESARSRDVRYLVVDPGAVLQHRIAARVQHMLDAGWLEETARLREQLPDTAPAWKASGYETLRAHLEGRLTRENAVERVIIETRQYAKRQRTWCRHQLGDGPVTLLDPDAPDAADRALAWWDGAADVAADAAAHEEARGA